jgi:hypothetical protein
VRSGSCHFTCRSTPTFALDPNNPDRGRVARTWRPDRSAVSPFHEIEDEYPQVVGVLRASALRPLIARGARSTSVRSRCRAAPVSVSVSGTM